MSFEWFFLQKVLPYFIVNVEWKPFALAAESHGARSDPTTDLHGTFATMKSCLDLCVGSSWLFMGCRCFFGVWFLERGWWVFFGVGEWWGRLFMDYKVFSFIVWFLERGLVGVFFELVNGGE